MISCVNGIDRQYPDYVDYSNQRIPAAGVKLNVDPEFLVCCDCTDGCQVSKETIFTLAFFKHLLMVEFFRINPEFRILRLTFHRKSASKC